MPSIDGGRVPTLARTFGRSGRAPPQVPGIRTTMPAASSAAMSLSSCIASLAVQRNG